MIAKNSRVMKPLCMASPLPLVARQDVDDEHEHDDGDDYAQRWHVDTFEPVDDDAPPLYCDQLRST
jgi:hypothetical protein